MHCETAVIVVVVQKMWIKKWEKDFKLIVQAMCSSLGKHVCYSKVVICSHPA